MQKITKNDCLWLNINCTNEAVIVNKVFFNYDGQAGNLPRGQRTWTRNVPLVSRRKNSLYFTNLQIATNGFDSYIDILQKYVNKFILYIYIYILYIYIYTLLLVKT